MTMETNPQSTLKVAGHPIHPMLVPFPIAFFVGAFLADIAFWLTTDPFFARGGAWLLGAGLLSAALAAVAGFADFLGSRAVRSLRPAWMHMIGNLVAVLLQVLNFVLRLGDPVAAVMPTGIGISLVVTLLLLFNGWMGWEMVYRGRVGIADR